MLIIDCTESLKQNLYFFSTSIFLSKNNLKKIFLQSVLIFFCCR